MNCPCGTREIYQNCCGRYISGEAIAPTPEALMRSRYTAYTQANTTYIAETQRGPAALGYDPIASKKWAQGLQWTGLDVFGSQQKGDKGFVAFKAYFQDNKQARTIFEKSEFHRIDGKWYYVDSIKIERNDPCPCGSGKKYKKCCLG